MSAEPTEQAIIEAICRDGRYPLAAYVFLRQGLEYTARRLFGEEAERQPRHVTGAQLCEGLRELAWERWGRLAPVVLRRWNIRRTRDFGEMVYFLIKIGAMSRQESDRIEDFDDVYDLETAFDAFPAALDEGPE